jgi:hypothetical protein
MPSSRIDASVREFSPESILCWCNGQSLESRYSSSVGGGGVPAVAIGKLIGNLILRKKLDKARLVEAVRMPRFPVIAAGATQIFIFSGPIVKRGPLATLQRDQAEIVHRGGPMWKRIDIIVPANGTSRSYTMMRFAAFGGAKQLRMLANELTGGGGTPQ